MSKITEAFRNISEVAEELDVPKHVLRFWEAKFVQLKPMKRGGGRRYYRPEDVVLLKGIRHLLYSDGYTIRGVQKLLREQGIDYVKSCAPEGSISEKKETEHETGKVVSLQEKRDEKTNSDAEQALDIEQKDALISALSELEECKKILHSIEH